MHRVVPVFRQLRRIAGLFEQVAEAVVEAEGDEHADGEEGGELDQRLEGDRQHHAAVVFGDVQRAGAEHDAEQRQHQRHDHRRVLRADAAGVGPGADQQVHPEDDALQLQGDVGQHADHADQRHHHGERLRLAVARGDEVGDGGDVLLLADHDHLLQHPGGEQHQQHRAEIDRQERPELVGGLADGAEEGPAGAVHGQRQAVDPGPQARRKRRATAVAIEGDGEQDGHVEEGDRGDQPAGQRHENSVDGLRLARRAGKSGCLASFAPKRGDVRGLLPRSVGAGMAGGALCRTGAFCSRASSLLRDARGMDRRVDEAFLIHHYIAEPPASGCPLEPPQSMLVACRPFATAPSVEWSRADGT
ncbi:hypothetical protein D3C76_861550 [compost metagenome]